jgi:hypothetical protein
MEGSAKERHTSWLDCATPRLSKVFYTLYILTILDIDDIMVVTIFIGVTYAGIT